MSEPKKFKEKSTYRLNIFLIALIVIGFLYVLLFTILKTDDEIIKIFAERELYGRAKTRGAILLGRYLANNWGKSGILFSTLLMVFGAAYFLLKVLFEYRRFLKKDKLFRKGLVDNLNDDYVPVSLFHRLKTLFRPSQGKKSYPSEKEMKEALNKNKYFKNDSNL